MLLQPEQISELIADLYINANRRLPPDVVDALTGALHREDNPLAREAMTVMLDNLKLTGPLPICQDTGLAVVFCRWGGQVQLASGTLQEAVNAGIAKACQTGFLRPSMVGDPLRRVNTGDNTPAILHVEIVAGDTVHFTVAPKGFGSENMTALRMFTPAAAPEDIVDFVVQTVADAGGNPCPPTVIGVGLGGTSEVAALAAKEALLCPVNVPNADPFYADLEKTALARVNALGIGAQGFGGSTTALGLHILPRPTHIAGLPCAVALGCWVTRHASGTLRS